MKGKLSALVFVLILSVLIICVLISWHEREEQVTAFVNANLIPMTAETNDSF